MFRTISASANWNIISPIDHWLSRDSSGSESGNGSSGGSSSGSGETPAQAPETYDETEIDDLFDWLSGASK